MDKIAEGYGLVEAPVWVPGQGLMYSDVLNGGVFCVSPEGDVSTVFSHRRGIGGMSLHESGGMIVSGRNIACKSIPEDNTQILLDRDEANGQLGFNDITTDSTGRVYAGSVDTNPFDDNLESNPGNLYVIDLDGSARIVARDFLLTNGLGFSPDGRNLYHSDYGRGHINAYTVHADGSLGDKEILIKSDQGPDGLVVSEDGRIWVALEAGGGVAVYEANGNQCDFISIPQPMCTSLCFGGDDLRSLYIVSGSRGMDSDTAGSVYVDSVDVAGVPVAPARVTLQSTR